MLDYAAVTLAPAYLLGSLDACSPQVHPHVQRVPVRTLPGYALRGNK